MAASQTLTLGPQHGSIVVRTSREGAAAHAGHDLVIDATGWEATLDLERGAVTLDVDPRSLVVREGVGGLKPLTDEDKGRIHATIDEKVLGGDPITFRSHEVRGTDGALVVSGRLTLAGETRDLRAELSLENGALRGTIPVAQTAWGITPQSAMLGQLRVGDEVEVVVEVRIPVLAG
jgi:hypothetical protein